MPFSQQMQFRPDMMGFRPTEWSMQGQQRPDLMNEQQWGQRRPEGFEIHPKSAEFSSSSPSQEVGFSEKRRTIFKLRTKINTLYFQVMGEIYGRKFGRVLQDLIAARIQNSLMQQQQAQQSNQMMVNLA